MRCFDIDGSPLPFVLQRRARRKEEGYMAEVWEALITVQKDEILGHPTSADP